MRDTAHPRLARGGGKIAGRLEDAAMFDAHHRLLHHSDWVVRPRDGLPEFIPPAWIGPQRRPRAAPRPLAVRAKLPGSAPPLLAMLDE